jgi:hypothetical protein
VLFSDSLTDSAGAGGGRRDFMINEDAEADAKAT